MKKEEVNDKDSNRKKDILHPISNTNLGLNSVQVHKDTSIKQKYNVKKSTITKPTNTKQIKPPPKRTTNLFKDNKRTSTQSKSKATLIN